MEDKALWRKRIWQKMEAQGVTLFPGARGRIPNFVGAPQAAGLLSKEPEWKAARTIKANPDSPQRSVRALALEQSKRVFMAVPRLRQSQCFIELDPARLGAKVKAAASIRGALRLGRPVHPREMPRIDLIVAGSVVVNRRGVRIGKGGGYSDLEYALGREFGFVEEDTPIVTTVHTVQLVRDELPSTDHDFDVDLIVTPEATVRATSARRRPPGILWDQLSSEYLEGIPILRDLRRNRSGAGGNDS